MKMGGVTCLCLVLVGMLCSVQAQTFLIRKKFINGNLEFTWTNVNTRRNDIVIVTDGRRSGWIQTIDDKYTVEDVWKYKSVKIFVREYTTADFRSFDDYNSTYTISRIDSVEGERRNLKWKADFFPRAAGYTIYHFDGDNGTIIMRVENKGVTTDNPSKYTYNTMPYNSTNINFEVKDIGAMDGGYYGGGPTQTEARSGPGVVLVVGGKPTTPEIKGNMKVVENGYLTLTCSSKSTSRPSYYSKYVSLSYIWYRNNSVIDSKTRMTLTFPSISKNHRFNKYSCRSMETIQSEKSDEIHINVLCE